MEKQKSKSQIISDCVCGIIMLLSIAAYLIIGLFWGLWHPCWAIIIIAALVCGLIHVIVNTVTMLKTSKNINTNTKIEE